MRFTDFTQFSQWLDQKGLFHMELGLERMRHALAELDLPAFPVIQVLGTNGKGSTSSFLASLACGHGLRCGLYLSPHFISVRERISINGRLFGESDWLEAINALAEAINLDNLTYFEIITLMAAWLFAHHHVDVAIIEAGLGGKNDATSSLPAIAHCFTPVAMDHAFIIGPALADIARDKAAAIQHGAHVFSCPQYPAAGREISLASQRANSPLVFCHPYEKNSVEPWLLQGASQAHNAGLAITAWQWFAHANAIPVSLDSMQDCLKNAFLPGRLQTVVKPATNDLLVLDGAHNPHAIQALLRQPIPYPKSIIYSTLADKDWRTGAAMLCKAFPGSDYHLVHLKGDRAGDMNQVNKFFRQLGISSLRQDPDLQTALASSQGDTLVCGSLYLLADFYHLYPDFLGSFKP